METNDRIAKLFQTVKKTTELPLLDMFVHVTRILIHLCKFAKH